MMLIGIVKETSQSISSSERGMNSELLQSYFMSDVGHRVPSKSDSIAGYSSHSCFCNCSPLKL